MRAWGWGMVGLGFPRRPPQNSVPCSVRCSSRPVLVAFTAALVGPGAQGHSPAMPPSQPHRQALAWSCVFLTVHEKPHCLLALAAWRWTGRAAAAAAPELERTAEWTAPAPLLPSPYYGTRHFTKLGAAQAAAFKPNPLVVASVQARKRERERFVQGAPPAAL